MLRKAAKKKKNSSGLPEPRIEFINDEIYISRDGATTQPLLKERGFAVEISDEARCHIARTISRLLPDVIESRKAALIEYSVKVLEVLCRDQMPRVREILSEEMKEMSVAPHEVMVTLARDEMKSVSIPVLRCSPVLTDQDLIEIIKTAHIPEVLEAIASRSRLSSMVSHALAMVRLPKPLEKLLCNESAEIDLPSFDIITEVATDNESMHIPLMTRPDLPVRLINKIAAFLSEAVVDVLLNRYSLSPNIKTRLQDSVKERITTPAVERQKTAHRTAEELYEAGLLDDVSIEDALNFGDYAFVTQALAKMSRFRPDTVNRILKSENAKAITALCWKAKISMRNCLQIQIRMGKINHTKLLHARKGTDYPISKHDAEMYLDLFG